MRTRIAQILIIAAALLLSSFETGAKTSKAPGGARPSKLVYVNTYRFDPLIGLPDLRSPKAPVPERPEPRPGLGRPDQRRRGHSHAGTPRYGT